MDAIDRQRIVDRYLARLAEYGDDPRTLASGPQERRALRFEVLRGVGIESGSHVLDIGCGFGYFYEWLAQNGLDVEYTGVDINPSLVEIAARRHPDARFIVGDLQRDPIAGRFDFVVSSSAFNLPLVSIDNYAFVEDMLARAFALATHGVACDFLSAYAEWHSPEAFYYSPERVFASAKRLTKRVCLRHDYPLFEFCLYLFPDFQGWRTAA